MPLERMCGRVGCPLAGAPTSERRCPACGFVTVEQTDADVERLERAQAAAGLAGGIVDDGPPVLIVTSDEVPGHRITAVHGDVFGLTVRTHNFVGNALAQVRTVVGGEVGSYTQLLARSRNQARARLRDEARRVGANAVVAMRFDCNALSQIMTEVAAYGTAVTIEPPLEPPAVPAP